MTAVRTASPWQRNQAKRVIKTPKYHVVDSGLATTLPDLGETAWRDQRTRMGHLLESFVVQQVISQAGWTGCELRFHHYHDKDQVEVDLVIVRGRDT